MPPRIRAFAPDDADAVEALWRACGLTRPWNDPGKDIARKLTVQPELFLVLEDADDGALVGCAMAGYDGHRGCVYYLAIDPARRGEGLGRRLMEEIERRLTGLGCPKINLMVRADNAAALGFYESLGYTPETSTPLGKRLIED